MRRVILVLLIIVPAFIRAQNADSAWIRQNYYKMEERIPMRDGVKLYTAVYVPDDTTENHPILMERTPYSCWPYGKNNWRHFWNTYWKNYFREKYIIVLQDVRGRWMSGGKFEDMRPYIADKKGNETDEASDAYDAIDWLVKNVPHNNHRVGVLGISYPGFYATMAAASDHPDLKAVSPQAPCTNWFIGDDTHHNGALFVMDEFDFDVGWGFERAPKNPTIFPARPMDYFTSDNYKFYLDEGALKNLTKLSGDTIEWWNEIMDHPNYDSFWKARDARRATKNLKPAMLWVGGLFDAEDNWGAWHSYFSAEKDNPEKDFNKIVMGPWYHGQWASNDGTSLGDIKFGSNTADWYQQKVEIPFFNYYLKGEGNISNISEVTIFITGTDEWEHFNHWPPKETEDRTLYLTGNDGLSWKKPDSKKSFDQYTSDPSHPVPYISKIHSERTPDYLIGDQRFAGRRPDVLSFQSRVLDGDITVTGNVTADMLTSLSTTDADFIVKLIDVFPDRLTDGDSAFYAGDDPSDLWHMEGYEMMVHAEVMRGRYRNSFEKPEPFVPGKIERVKFSIGNIAHTFKKGHRIMVQVQSTWFPLVDRNPQQFVDIYHCSDSDFIKTDVRIYHDRNSASNIILPVYKPMSSEVIKPEEIKKEIKKETSTRPRR